MHPQLTYRPPHIGRKTCGRSPAGRVLAVDIPLQSFHECLFAITRQTCPICLCTPIKRFPDALHVFGHRKIADPHFAQITVHVRTEMIEERLPEFPQFWVVRQPAENQGQMQNQAQACANCGMPKDEWRGNNGQGFQMADKTYCCQGCAEGTGCTCVAVGKPGFSRRGQKLTRAEPRPGEQRSGAPAPKGELSGERDNLGTEEAIDQSGVSSAFTEPE